MHISTGQDSVEVGELPTLAHSVSGVFYVDDAVTFRIENFTYDGQGPGISHQSGFVTLYSNLSLIYYALVLTE